MLKEGILFESDYFTSKRFFTSQVKAAVLDPDNGFNVDRTLTKDDVKRLITVRNYGLCNFDYLGGNDILFEILYDMINLAIVWCQWFVLTGKDQLKEALWSLLNYFIDMSCLNV